MDNHLEVREFLTTRRARVTPEQAGLTHGGNRRVPGLRRSEVAMLADVSVEYYARIERGNLSGASETVLESIARALHLDDAERDHLFNLARASNGSLARRPRRDTRPTATRPSLQLVLDAVTVGPAFVRNGRMDILATNQLADGFFSEILLDRRRPANLARFQFLDLERSEKFYPDWSLAADVCVSIMRTEAGRDPFDRDMQELVGELSTRSEEFRTRWGAHNVRHHGSGVKRFNHPAVGELSLAYEGMLLEADPGLTLTVYCAQPGTPSEEGLRLLASWAASRELPQSIGTPEEADVLPSTTDARAS